ncbi:MAG TPA: hypothetical protein VKU60_14200 [Chloroflexota bacterium]|nr:hypothetical protein [Chloroflexota bacterium]
MEYGEQLTNMLRRLSDANQALLAWDLIAEQKRLSPDAPRPHIKRPSLSRRALKLQLVLLMADMSRLQQEISAAPLFSAN